MALLPLIPSIGVAALVAWLLTRGRGLEAWPAFAAVLQLVCHFLWSGVIAGHTGLSDSVALPLASGLGVMTIAGMSLLFRLVRSPRREAKDFGVLEPDAEKQAGEPEVPEAWVVQPWAGSGEPRPKRKRYFFTRRWR